MEAPNIILLLLSGFAAGLMLGAWLVWVASYKQGYADAKSEQVAELEQWKLEALSLRLQVASVPTLY